MLWLLVSLLAADRLSLSAGAVQWTLPLDALQCDGSLLLTTKTTIAHFTPTGQLIRKLGLPGNGPGEFMQIDYAVWNGEQYVVRDLYRYDCSFFDSSGLFVARRLNHARYLSWVGGRYFMVDNKPIFKNMPSLDAIHEISFDKRYKAVKRASFHHFQPIVFIYAREYRIHYFAQWDNELFVINQASPQVFVYDDHFQLKRTFKADLGAYVAPLPEKEPFFGGAFFEKAKSISVIYQMFRVGDYLAVCYFGPERSKSVYGVISDPRLRSCYLQLLDRQGKALAPPHMTEGPCLGVFEGKLLFADNYSGKVITLYRKDLAALMTGAEEGASHGKR